MNIKKLPAFGIAAVLLGFEEAHCMPASSKSVEKGAGHSVSSDTTVALGPRTRSKTIGQNQGHSVDSGPTVAIASPAPSEESATSGDGNGPGLSEGNSVSSDATFGIGSRTRSKTLPKGTTVFPTIGQNQGHSVDSGPTVAIASSAPSEGNSDRPPVGNASSALSEESATSGDGNGPGLSEGNSVSSDATIGSPAPSKTLPKRTRRRGVTPYEKKLPGGPTFAIGPTTVSKVTPYEKTQPPASSTGGSPTGYESLKHPTIWTQPRAFCPRHVTPDEKTQPTVFPAFGKGQNRPTIWTQPMTVCPPAYSTAFGPGQNRPTIWTQPRTLGPGDTVFPVNPIMKAVGPGLVTPYEKTQPPASSTITLPKGTPASSTRAFGPGQKHPTIWTLPRTLGPGDTVFPVNPIMKDGCSTSLALARRHCNVDQQAFGPRHVTPDEKPAYSMMTFAPEFVTPDEKTQPMTLPKGTTFHHMFTPPQPASSTMTFGSGRKHPTIWKTLGQGDTVFPDFGPMRDEMRKSSIKISTTLNVAIAGGP
eukprot:GHVS01006035.1.p1 GENE.GHVS01006035.1~~GHVS01006035.1.p1  ORF type:complete len:532 (+),score=43.20 GHVS01006035.1:88-1683(+)